MHNPESVLENETHKILCDFEIQTDHQISPRQPDLEIVKNTHTHTHTQKKKRTRWIVDFAVPADHRVNPKESEKRDKYQDPGRELKNYGTWT